MEDFREVHPAPVANYVEADYNAQKRRYRIRRFVKRTPVIVATLLLIVAAPFIIANATSDKHDDSAKDTSSHSTAAPKTVSKAKTSTPTATTPAPQPAATPASQPAAAAPAAQPAPVPTPVTVTPKRVVVPVRRVVTTTRTTHTTVAAAKPVTTTHTTTVQTKPVSTTTTTVATTQPGATTTHTAVTTTPVKPVKTVKPGAAHTGQTTKPGNNGNHGNTGNGNNGNQNAPAHGNNNQPTHNTPVHQQPTHNAPAQHQPTHNTPPAHNQPVHQQPTHNTPPAHNQPVHQQPAQHAPQQQQPNHPAVVHGQTIHGPEQSERDIYQGYAKELVQSGRLSDQDGRYMAQIKAIAKGDFSCNVNPTIIRMLYGVVVKDKHKIKMSSLNRKCTGIITASGTSSYHYRDGGGHAIDVIMYDGDPVVGSNDNTKDYLKEASKYLPKDTGYGQSECGSNFNIPNGSYKFSDTCNHQHIQVPVRQIKDLDKKPTKTFTHYHN